MNRRRPLALRVLVPLVLLASLLTVAPIASKDADALSSFDTELLQLLNDHRSGLGLNRLVEYGPLSAAAAGWSTTMRNDSGPPCGFEGHRHDTAERIQRGGLPPGWTNWGENIAFACGSPGVKFGIDWNYSNMPAICGPSIDFTTPLMQFCQWVDSASHRSAIESATFTHIGVGTATKSSSAATSVFSTTRFARAPVELTCHGELVTVDLSKNEQPTEGADVIVGTSGADTINALGGDDIVCGEGGADVINGGDGADLIDGGGGADKLFGSAGDDRILGGFGDDVIHGNRGNDELWGQSGNDRLFGYADNDELRGGDGADALHGNRGDDRLFGDAGDDRMFGYTHDDYLVGGSGADLMVGNFGDDTLVGEAGNDRLIGADGADNLDGGPNNDVLEGNSGSDVLAGGSGADVLDGGIEFDYCHGQADRDTALRCERQTSVP